MLNKALVRPFHDETIQSILFRAHLIHSKNSYQEYIRSLFGSIVVFGNPLSTKYNKAVNNLSSLLDIPAETIFKNHTYVPYYLAFLGDRVAHNELFSYLKPLVIRKWFNRKLICPICLDEDRMKFGISYFHRAHNLPFVNVCVKHEVYLNDFCSSCEYIFGGEVTSYRSHLCRDCDRNTWSNAKLCSDENELSWAKESNAILNSNIVVDFKKLLSFITRRGDRLEGGIEELNNRFNSLALTYPFDNKAIKRVYFPWRIIQKINGRKNGAINCISDQDFAEKYYSLDRLVFPLVCSLILKCFNENILEFLKNCQIRDENITQNIIDNCLNG